MRVKVNHDLIFQRDCDNQILFLIVMKILHVYLQNLFIVKEKLMILLCGIFHHNKYAYLLCFASFLFQSLTKRVHVWCSHNWMSNVLE